MNGKKGLRVNDNWLGLEGRVVVVTGANGGIGRAIVRALLENGAHVAMLDREALSAQEVAELAADTSGQCIALACDVADDVQVEAAAEAVSRKLGDCFALVNNAAVSIPGHLDVIDLADWSHQININLTGYLRCARAFATSMRANRAGSIVHIASIAGSNPQSFSGAYSSTKAAILMLSRQLAFEWGPYGIRNNVISPGLTRTPLTEPYYVDSQMRAQRENAVPLRRIGVPEDIANVAVFLVSERSSYMNGSEMVVDGGFTQSLMSHIPRPRRS